jgi:hypothetical protein
MISMVTLRILPVNLDRASGEQFQCRGLEAAQLARRKRSHVAPVGVTHSGSRNTHAAAF